MTCSPFDLRDYFLQELPDPQQRQVEAHVKLCQPCREELDRLRVTEAALLCLRDEEIPQRIAFVSDKIFEPSPWRRWWAAFWGSAARLGFASSALLSAAIVVYALHPVGQPAMPVQLAAETPRPAQQIVQTVSDAEIQSRIDAAVTKAVARIERRETEQTKSLMADLESMRKRFVVAASVLEMYDKRDRVIQTQANNYGPPQKQEDR
jgi:hypothetical protein